MFSNLLIFLVRNIKKTNVTFFFLLSFFKLKKKNGREERKIIMILRKLKMLEMVLSDGKKKRQPNFCQMVLISTMLSILNITASTVELMFWRDAGKPETETSQAKQTRSCHQLSDSQSEPRDAIAMSLMQLHSTWRKHHKVVSLCGISAREARCAFHCSHWI